MYRKPTIAPYRPAWDTDFGTAINDIPTYIFVKFAAVKYQGMFLCFFSFGDKCLSVNYEFV